MSQFKNLTDRKIKSSKFIIGITLISLISLIAVMTGSIQLPLAGRQTANSAKAAEILRFEVPAVTHGFTKVPSLPDGDQFLLPKPFTMAVTEAAEGAQVFPVNIENFGGEAEEIGALPEVKPQGLSFSTSNAKVRAISCAESIWDSNLLIASTAGTDGDTVRFFLEETDGDKGPELGLFTVARAGVVVTSLHPDLMLFVNNRKAMGPSWRVGDYIPFAVGAGNNGMRTDLLTLAWPMMKFSELQGCFRIGVEISRGGSQGTTSVVFTDIVVNRNRVPGDENNPGYGLLGRLTGGYPTGFPCKAECPFPDDIPNPPFPFPGGGGGGDECNAICFRSPQFFLLNVNHLPHGTVLVGGMNSNRPISTTNKRVMRMALQGGFTPLQGLNEEFVAAQLNALLAGGAGSAKYFYAMEGRLTCYNLKFDSITLRSGFVLTPGSKLKDLFQQAQFSIRDNVAADQIALTKVFDQLNGNNPFATCNNLWK